MGLPPGSRLPPVAQTALIVHDPVGFFGQNRRRFGPVFRARFVGVPHLVYVATPALAELVLRTDRDIGQAGTARKDFLEPLVGPDSVLCLEGEPWMRERRRLAPAFHGQRLGSLTDTIADIVAAEVKTWPVGEPFALRPRMQRITLEVIFDVVFGARPTDTAANGDREAFDARRRLRVLLPELLDVGATPVLAFVPPRLGAWLQQSSWAQRLPRNTVAGFYRMKATVDELLLAEIGHHRSRAAFDHQSVLGMLAAIPDATESQIRDELVTLLEAGHETTATGLAWLFEQLLRLPDVLARVYDAIDRADEAYLNAVIRESLRRRPVLIDAPRVLTAPLRLEGFEVPAGWYVAPVMPLVHTDRDTYPDAERFRPERFLDSKLPAGAWIPFGGSRRLCLGIQLALLEMRVVLTEVLKRVELTPVGAAAERARLRGVTLIPEHQTRVVARPSPRR
jgi:cytochrome P450 family 135